MFGLIEKYTRSSKGRLQSNAWRHSALSIESQAGIDAMTTRRKKAKARKPTRRGSANARWSGRVTKESNALDLKHGVFTWSDPRRIATSLKRSAEHSRRRKAQPYRSALSMLTFYINRGGKNLPARRKKILEQAKVELRRQFGRA
jgi:hypothetical protein